MADAAEDNGTSAEPLCSEIQITVRIKECPEIKNSIISKVKSDPQQFKLLNQIFTFDYIKWGDESQEQVYKAAGFPFVEKALEGHSVTILAYGPSGSGKSYTMGSLISDWKNTGLIQRCLKQIFEESKVQVSASFLELYNKELHDLLDMGAIVHKGVAFSPKIEGISSLEEGLLIINRALKIRRERQNSCGSSSGSNTSTSQSHAWLTLHLKIENGDKFLESKLNLVDLAGSTITRSETGRFVSTRKFNFNESLSALNKVMAESCSKKSDPMLSSKDSMLASVLKDLLDAKCLVSLVACISSDPASDCRSIFRTLRVAENIKSLRNQRNMEPTDSGLSYDQLIPKTEKVVEPESENIENTKDQDKNPVITPLEEGKLKKCIVVLKKSDVDLYGNKKRLRAKESNESNIAAENSEEDDGDLDKTPLAHVEAVYYSAETKSTLSISKVETENTDNETFVRNDFSFSQYNKSIGSDDNLSLSSLEDLVTRQTPTKFHDNDISGSDCQGVFNSFPSPMVFLPLSQSTSHESLEEKDNILANVSQLSITGYGLVNPEYHGGIEATVRSEAALGNVNQLQMFEKQTVPDSQSVVIKSSKLKRLNAILTTDFSDPGPSDQTNDEVPRKIIKLDESPILDEQRVAPDFDLKSGEKHLDDDELCDNIENRKKELNNKQNAHNRNILRILNTSTAEQLTDLPRVGFKTAVSIYQYRLIHGEFKSLKSLESLPIWNERTCQKFFAANNVFFE